MLWLIILLVLYLGILALALRMSLYPIRTPIFISPGALGVPQEEFQVQSTDDITIRGWKTQPPNPKGVLLMAHGYLMNRSELSPLAVQLYEKGWASMILDLRAHGKSGGKKATFGVLERHDVAAAAKLAREEFPNLPIVMVGSSMGSAACAFALADDPSLADGLVLDSSYSKLPDAVLGWWYFLGGKPLRAFLWPSVFVAAPFVGFNPFKVDVAEAVKKLKIKVLLMHGDVDTLANPRQAARNLEAAGDCGEIVWFEGCGHSEGRWIHPERYIRSLEAYLEMVRANFQSFAENHLAPF